jgi:hypothetical protein
MLLNLFDEIDGLGPETQFDATFQKPVMFTSNIASD